MVVQEVSKMCVEKAHDLLGHSNEDATRATANHLGWELYHSAKPCQSCAEAKAKQKIVQKKTEAKKATRPNERLFQYLAMIKAPKSLDMTVTRPHWQLIVNERKTMKFSSHHETKAGMVEPTCVKLSKLADIAGGIAHLRQDNTGKTLKLAKRIGSANWKMKIAQLGNHGSRHHPKSPALECPCQQEVQGTFPQLH